MTAILHYFDHHLNQFVPAFLIGVIGMIGLIVMFLYMIFKPRRNRRLREKEEMYHYPEGEAWYDEAHHYVKDHINNSDDFKGYM